MILKTLLLLILILFPFGELLRFQIGNYVVLKPIDVVVGVTAMVWIFIRLKSVQNSKFKIQNYSSKFKSLKKNYLFLPLVLFIAIGFVSLLINLSWLKPQEFVISLLYLIRWVSYALLLPIVLQFDKAFKKKIAVFFFIDGLILLVFGYLQYFFYNNLKNLYYLGWDDHMHRLLSSILDPNFASVFFVLYLLFVAGIFFKNHESRIMNQGFIICILLLSLIAIFLTFSRSGLISLIAGGVTFLWLMGKKRLIFLVFAGVALFVLIASPKFYDENMNLFRHASSNARLANIEVGLRVFTDHPLIGVGFNSYRYTKELYGLDHDWVNAPSHSDAGVDNSYLFVLATTGLVGFFAYGLIWFRLLKRAFVLHRKKLSVGAVVVMASSAALFTNALFINSMFFAPLMLWMWMMFGLYEDLE